MLSQKIEKKNDGEVRQLIEMAIEARKNSYSPYSNYQVGACLQGKSGNLYTGCNIENAGYSATNCAERTAFFKAVSQGENKFKRIALVGGKKGQKLEFCPPCGICRQVMQEFCDPEEFEIIIAISAEKYQSYLLKEILPLGFTLEK